LHWLQTNCSLTQKTSGYQIDCLKLYEELTTKDCKVLICIIDHFRKYLYAALFARHAAEEVEFTCREFFRFIGIPKFFKAIMTGGLQMKELLVT